MPKPKQHVFVCVQNRPEDHPRGSCASAGGMLVMQKFSEEIAKRGLFNDFAVTSTGCLGPCHLGGNVLIYPGGYLYTQITVEDVPKIIEQHLLGGEPITDRLAPADVW